MDGGEWDADCVSTFYNLGGRCEVVLIETGGGQGAEVAEEDDC